MLRQNTSLPIPTLASSSLIPLSPLVPISHVRFLATVTTCNLEILLCQVVWLQVHLHLLLKSISLKLSGKLYVTMPPLSEVPHDSLFSSCCFFKLQLFIFLPQPPVLLANLHHLPGRRSLHCFFSGTDNWRSSQRSQSLAAAWKRGGEPNGLECCGCTSNRSKLQQVIGSPNVTTVI